MAAQAGLPAESPLARAFAATPREKFLPPPPWKVFTRAENALLLDDPAMLYQDLVISLGKAQINNGQPSLHAICIAALDPQPGETVAHIGAGMGYYTAILARLVGAGGRVHAYEIDPDLAAAAQVNLRDLPQAKVRATSGTEGPLDSCDIIYVNASATHPLPAWLDALAPQGRLMFPLAPTYGAGAMLRITRGAGDCCPARFFMPVHFIPCTGAQDSAASAQLTAAFRRGNLGAVRSLARGSVPQADSWAAGPGWALSTRPCGPPQAR